MKLAAQYVVAFVAAHGLWVVSQWTCPRGYDLLWKLTAIARVIS